MIQPSASFKDNLQQLPPIDALARIELLDATGTVVDTIENEAGRKGSLAVYNYIAGTFEALDAKAAAHAVAVFAEHGEEAKSHRGSHPNIDRLLDIIGGAPALALRPVLAA
ncbi:DUF2322 family protein [Thioclava sp. GXIMD2076]|uniref:DUF2322 family protein n=1 Tax=Thioclava kandeliae TaxID=3070818 RepID=A0ABV1SIZ3_9RHOB